MSATRRRIVVAPEPRPARYPLVVVLGVRTIRELIDDLEAALLRRNRSPKTVLTYRWALKDLADFAQAAGVDQVGDVTEHLLEEWQDSLIGRHLAPSTRSVAASAARGLIKLGSRHHLMDRSLEDAVETVTVPEHLPRPIADDDLLAVLAALREPPKGATLAQLRDRALFFYLLTTGARVSEILRIRRDDYERPIVRQKGGREKRLYPPPAAIATVELYLSRRTDTLPDLFVTHARGSAPVRALSPGPVRKIWSRMAAELGVARWTTHQLRHTSATVLSDAEFGDLVIAQHLGHRGLASLPNYAKISERRRAGVVSLFERLMGPAAPVADVIQLRKPINKKRRRRR